jgi:hypothetical protein
MKSRVFCINIQFKVEYITLRPPPPIAHRSRAPATAALAVPLCQRGGGDLHFENPPYSGTMGHAGAVVPHPGGTLEGAHDPRADGGAAGV